MSTKRNSSSSTPTTASSESTDDLPVIDPPEVVDEALGDEGPEVTGTPTESRAEEPPSVPQLVDPTPTIDAPTALVEVPTVSVRILRNEASVVLGAGHYTLKAGTTMVVQQPVADELVARKLAERI